MSISIKEARTHIEMVPRVNLGFFPTPLYKLEKMSKELGINLFIKRDDFTGKNLFGGNKTRKLEFLIGKAIEEKCEYVFTYGATQSNHAMQTICSAVSNGIKPVVYLSAVVEPDEKDMRANLLLDKIFDAEIHLVRLKDNETFKEAEERAFALGAEHIKKLEEEGHKCMDIPMGGANYVGSAGYIAGMAELCEQAEAIGVNFEYLYHSTGSGGTMAGLVAGRNLLGMSTVIRSIAALDKGKDYASNMTKLANGALNYLHFEPLVEEKDFNVDTGFYAPGYECPNEGATEAIKMLAKNEGILVDPVYSGKALAGLIHDARTGKIQRESNVVFLHTGGATALFAEKEILGSII